MFNQLVSSNASELFLETLRTILANGANVQIGRTNQPTKEVLFYTGILQNPQFRWILLPWRKMNTFAACFETLWVLSGSKNLDLLKKVLPRAVDFSDDDGLTWRASYGNRLINYGGMGFGLSDVNQLDYILRTLVNDPSSRQAVASLWNPELDSNQKKYKDRPCTNHLQYFVRDGKLHQSVLIRSNDLIWGASGINWIEFTVIQQVMLDFFNRSNSNLRLSLGCYVHRSNSMHIYTERMKLKEKDIAGEIYPNSYADFSYPEDNSKYATITDFYSLSNFINSFLYECWNSEEPSPVWGNTVLPPIITDLLYAICAYKEIDPRNSELLDCIIDPNLKKSLQMSWIPENHLELLKS